MRIALATVGTTGDVLARCRRRRRSVGGRPPCRRPGHWADRLQRLGVAPRPVALKRLDATSLADTVFAAAADRRMREKARALAVRVGAEDGIGASVLLLENAAAGATYARFDFLGALGGRVRT